MKSLSFVIFTMAVAVACSGCGKDGTPCGAGTMDRDGRCVADVLCGTGTVNVGGVCAAGDAGATCGAGTVNVGGECVREDATACGAGTVNVGGECVPDGSLICAQGTVFNPATSHCELDPRACAPGTALVGGVCVPEDDSRSVDLEEAVEPNDETGAGHFDAPAIGESVTIHGCVTPVLGTADIDNWVITASGPTLLEITADGVHGLTAAFSVGDGSHNPKLANWQRLGLNLTGDTSKRQVFLPAAGDYLLRMDDSRALILDGTAVGGADTCYFGTIKGVALPAATALLPTMSAQDNGNVRVFSFDATAKGDILYVNEFPTTGAMAPGFVVLRQGALAADAIFNSYAVVGGLEPTNDRVEIIVDNAINYGVTPQTYTLTSTRIQSHALPTDGATVRMTHFSHDREIWEQHYFYFDVAESDQLVHLDILSSLDVDMVIVRRDLINSNGSWDSIAFANAGVFQTQFKDFIRFDQPGRYYLVAYDHLDITTGAYDTTSTLTNMAISPVTYGMPMTAQTITDQGSTFYSYHVDANQQWAELSVLAEANWRGGQARLSFYDLGRRGWFTAGSMLQVGTQPPDGLHPLHRIVLGEPHDYLIRVEDTFSHTAPPTFTLDIKEHPGFVDLGTIAVGTPILRTGMDNIPPGGMLRYLVKASANDRLHVEVTPDPASDIAIDRLYPDETSRATTDSGRQGAAETLDMIFPGESPQWVAFAVRNLSATASSPTLSLTTSASPFASICDATTVLPSPFDGNAEGEFTTIQTLPPGFTFFGVPVTTFFINADGFLSFASTSPSCFDGCGSNFGIPFAPSPNNMIAAYWDDLRDVRICRKDDAINHTVTIQWSGRLLRDSSPVDVQAVLHQDGKVDFQYGDQQADGSSATVGVENSSGTVGKQLVFAKPGSITPGLSLSVTTP